MIKILWVGLGGFIGSILRYQIGEWLQRISSHTQLPLATLTVNLLGCFGIGLIYAYLEKTQQLNSELRLLLIIGFLGGFTTFSAFGLEKLHLIKSQLWLELMLYLFFHIFFGVLLVWLGYQMMR